MRVEAWHGRDEVTLPWECAEGYIRVMRSIELQRVTFGG